MNTFVLLRGEATLPVIRGKLSEQNVASGILFYSPYVS